jgi:hypothetical protein
VNKANLFQDVICTHDHLRVNECFHRSLTFPPPRCAEDNERSGPMAGDTASAIYALLSLGLLFTLVVMAEILFYRMLKFQLYRFVFALQTWNLAYTASVLLLGLPVWRLRVRHVCPAGRHRHLPHPSALAARAQHQQDV